MGYNMNLGSKENDTPGSFSEAQWKRLTEKFNMAIPGFGAISGVTGNRVNVPESIRTISSTYEDPSKRLEALKDLYSGLSARSRSEVSKKLGPYSGLFK